MTLTAHLADWLLQGAAAVRDTQLVRQVGAEPNWFTKLTSIASGLVSIALLVLTVALVPAALNFRKTYSKVSDMLDRIYADINPITRHASSIVDNIDYVTTAIRTDVQQVSRTIQTANTRLEEALGRAERRLRELDALMRVVQSEAENTFVSTAATLRGMRAGAVAFRDEAAAMIAPDDDDLEDDVLDVDEESEHGDDSTPAIEREGPRIRRPRRRGTA